MPDDLMPNDSATQSQHIAARPDKSTWLSANAGSGKTRVLTDRVARLLLKGTEPQNILCLTYTKAAASEMQNRLFQRLGKWTMLGDDALQNELRTLGVEHDFSPNDLNQARSLFAQAIETPGGLKIQTIHSFCGHILRRFPLETQLSPDFIEIDDRTKQKLQTDIIEEIANSDGASSLDGIYEYGGDHNFDKLVEAILAHKSTLLQPLDQDKLFQMAGLKTGHTYTDLIAPLTTPDDISLIKQFMKDLKGHPSNALKTYNKLGKIDFSQSAKTVFTALKNAFLTKDETPLKPQSIAAQNVLKPLVYFADIQSYQDRVYDAVNVEKSLNLVHKTIALYDFAQDFINRYETRKSQSGYVDFNDLIEKTRALLRDPKLAQWVLFRLDGGIEHVLVDEAQDTSDPQWDVVKLLTQEFVAGQGAHDSDRTIFVVGDKKQSIFSFQGADPQKFDDMRDYFAKNLPNSETHFQNRDLSFSFRSAPAILKMVDTVFTGENGLGDRCDHEAFKYNLPGRVDVWPIIEPEKQDDAKDDPSNPQDKTTPQTPKKRLADQIAQNIKHMLENEFITSIDPQGNPSHRRIRPSDILILVRGRGGLFNEIHRACRQQNLAIAGADRMKIASELAVKDILTLLSYLAFPRDDLSLACALRSPIFGWNEQDLFTLAHHRGEHETLDQALFRQETQYPKTLAILRDLKGKLDFLRPYELMERILIEHDGRVQLLNRLGQEAQEGIDALLGQAVLYEQSNTPSLTSFISWVEAHDTEIKRQMDAVGDQIRVMTIHGAKGLEAPIVILPDTTKQAKSDTPHILTHENQPFWIGKNDVIADFIAPDVDKHKNTMRAEDDRLLYVALTRAENWLIICGAVGERPPKEHWHSRLQAAQSSLNTEPLPNSGWRYGDQNWIAGPNIETEKEISRFDPAPDCAHVKPDIFITKFQTLAPSDLGGAKVIPGNEDASLDALHHGNAVHFLLEHLPNHPVENWHNVAQQLLPDYAQHIQNNALAEAQKTITHPDLGPIFAQGLAEVSISADLGQNRIHGTIDRLLIEQNQITVIDYKTNRIVPNTADNIPNGILRQMGAYAQGIAQIYPDHRINLAILWTQTQTLMPVPLELAKQELEKIGLIHPTS